MKLAQNLRAGELVAVFIPDEKTEAIRDLERAQQDAKKTERVARHQLSKFLLRNGRRYPGKTTWNNAHRAWIAKEVFAEPAQQYVLSDGLATVEAASLRCLQLTERLRELTKDWELGPLVKALQALRGSRIRDSRDPGGRSGGFPAVRQGDGFHGVCRIGSLGADDREPPASGSDHQDGECPCAACAGRIGVALSEATANQQGVARAERGDLAAGLCDRVEGTEAVAQPAPTPDQPREEPRRGGDGGGT